MRYSVGSVEIWSFSFSLLPTLDPSSNSIECLLNYILSLCNSISPFMTSMFNCNSLFPVLLNSNIRPLIFFLYNVNNVENGEEDVNIFNKILIIKSSSTSKKIIQSQEWRPILIIPELERWRQEDQKYKVILAT